MLPEQPGTYVLIVRLCQRMTVAVGKLGAFDFPAGWYAYAGSARGPGGLAARVSRHCRKSKTPHWHIDYLRAHAKPVAAWYATGLEKRECSWARILLKLTGASIPASGFGASDCRCPTHLVRFPTPPDLSAFVRLVDGPVRESRFNG